MATAEAEAEPALWGLGWPAEAAMPPRPLMPPVTEYVWTVEYEPTVNAPTLIIPGVTFYKDDAETMPVVQPATVTVGAESVYSMPNPSGQGPPIENPVSEPMGVN